MPRKEIQDMQIYEAEHIVPGYAMHTLVNKKTISLVEVKSIHNKGVHTQDSF
jgi:hypothetical protein